MRVLKPLTLLAAIAGFCGCSNDAPPAATNASGVSNEPSAITPDKLPPSVQDAPEFDPRLTIEWPGTPEESRRRINAGQPDETTIYSATFLQNQARPVAIFAASVYQFTEKDLQGTDPKDLLAGHNTSGDEIELSRQQIEHGPNKLLGFDVVAKEDGGFRRRVNILAGTRIYSVDVLSGQQERLNAEDVAKFFESLQIKD